MEFTTRLLRHETWNLSLVFWDTITSVWDEFQYPVAGCWINDTPILSILIVTPQNSVANTATSYLEYKSGYIQIENKQQTITQKMADQVWFDFYVVLATRLCRPKL